MDYDNTTDWVKQTKHERKIYARCTRCGKRNESHYPHCIACQDKLGEDLMGDYVRCSNHRDGGATRCPRGGAALQIWQRQQREGR